MRAVHVLFAAVFIFAASLQFNDPDPLRWVLIYLLGASTCVLAFLGHARARGGAAVVGAVALIWGLSYLPAVVRHGQVGSMFEEWTMRNQEVLENREMFGLFILAAWMVVIVFCLRPREQKTA